MPSTACPPPLHPTSPAPGVRPEALMLLERVGGARLVRDMIALYTAYAPVRIGEARAALAAGDGEGVRRACHALKSGGAQLGLVALADQCERGERLAGRGELAALGALLDGLEHEYRRARTWLERRPVPVAD